MALSINLEDHYNYTLLELHGEISANTAPILRRALDLAIAEGNRHLVLECSLLTSISSDGLKILLSSQRKLSTFYRISMCNVEDSIAALLEMSGMTRFVAINNDIHDAETMLMEADYSTGRLYS